MGVPQYFQPDPEVEDADLLGIGEIVYDDGRREFVEDPEIPSLLPVVTAPAPGAASNFYGAPEPDAGPALKVPGAQFTPSMRSGFAGDRPGSGVPTAFNQDRKAADTATAREGGSPLAAVGKAAKAVGAASSASFAPPNAKAEEPAKNPVEAAREKLGLTSAGAASEPSPEASSDEPFNPVLSAARQLGIPEDNLVLAQRTGKLDPEVATRQAGERSEMDQNILNSAEQSRDAQWTGERLAIREERIKVRAQIEEQQRLQQEGQAKLARFRKEQAEVSDMKITDDLVSARGGIGAALLVLGAGLLGAIKSDAGLRMIDNAIDRHVRGQVSRRDSKLRALADQIGSEEQAINAAKAEYYKALEKHGDLMTRLTKADAFMANTPAVMDGIRQKQLEYNQAAERDSLGKSIEQLPPAGAGLDADRIERYGKMRRDRIASEQMAARGEKEIGLIWDEKKGDYANKAEILARGVQGKGNLEQWVPNWVYSTFGGVTEEGYQVRGVAESMAYAQIRQMQPTGPISNQDIQSAIKAGALDTEEGLVEGLRRIRSQSKTESQHDAAQFGPDVVQEYERRFRAGGGRNVNAQASPGASRPATLDDLNAPAQPTSQADPGNPMGNISAAVQAAAGEELGPEGIQILVAQAAHETADGKSAPNNNFFGHKAVGKQASASLETTEGAGKNARRMKQSFRKFADADESAREHVSLLKRKYPKAWEALQAGDESAYAAALKDGGYYTADESTYLAGIQRRL